VTFGGGTSDLRSRPTEQGGSRPRVPLPASSAAISPTATSIRSPRIGTTRRVRSPSVIDVSPRQRRRTVPPALPAHPSRVSTRSTETGRTRITSEDGRRSSRDRPEIPTIVLGVRAAVGGREARAVSAASRPARGSAIARLNRRDCQVFQRESPARRGSPVEEGRGDRARRRRTTESHTSRTSRQTPIGRTGSVARRRIISSDGATPLRSPPAVPTRMPARSSAPAAGTTGAVQTGGAG
jgi:hypothetical protein